MNINRAILRSKRLHTKIMEWTNDDALELIEQYRTHTELWNRADPKYKDKLCRFRAWSEIAERFGCSKAEVERKMNVLLTQYRREKHKMLVKLYQGIQPNPSKWYAFKRFDFMEAGGGGASVTMGMGMGMGVGVGVGMGMGMGIGISGAITGGNSGNSSGIVSVMHHHHRHQSGSGGSSSGAGNSNISNNNTNNNNSTASIIVGGLGGNSLLLNSNSFVHNNNHHSVGVSGCSNITGSDSGNGNGSGSGSGSNTNNSSSNNLRISKNVNITPNGHHPHHHHHHHHAHLPSHPHPHAHSLAHHHHHHHNAAAVAAAAALNGLAVANYESTATAVASAMPTTTSYHRRMKSKEMKYFGAMGLNMLLANAQPALDNWNALGQYSPPPLNERSHQLHGPLTMSFAAAAQQHHQQQQQQSGIGEVVGGGTSFTTQNLFSRASSNHSEEESTQKPMDTGEIECNDEKINLSKTKCESTTPTPTPTPTPTTTPALTITTTTRTRTITPSIETSIAIATGAATLTTAAAAATATATAATSIIERKILTPSNERQFERQTASTSHHTETYISSLGNDNSNNSTTPITVTGLGVPEQHTNTTSRSAILHIKNNNGSSPIPNTQIHDVHNEQQQHFQKHLLNSGHLIGTRNPNDIAIKQELLVDYFHAPHPPAPSDSQRSYSSTEDNRHLTDITDEYAQDLRVSAAAAAAAAAAKTLDFTRFVLPSGLRRSSDLLEEKFSPLNMRKLNSGASTVSSTAAGHMLMNSLLSNESTSEDNNVSISGRRKSDSIGSGQATQDAATSAAAATAAAIYAENFNKDDCDYVGSNVSVKLRTMDRTQRIIAEKLISEVLFYGQFNELERSARIQPK